CRDTSCGPGYISYWDSDKQASVCVSRTDISDDGQICPLDKLWRVKIGDYYNCCKLDDNKSGTRDAFGNCCLLGETTDNSITGVYWTATKGYWNSNHASQPITPTAQASDAMGNGTVPDAK